MYEAVNFYDLGLNWLLTGHNAKLTLAYQSRPIYTSTAQFPTHYRRTENKGATIVQFQVFFN
ncbi:MAG: hypothetical protein H7Y12_11545 [Sphingobacteriaceae bacterium]|nr:hypothetical protein [Cytophagaceae bacterium]